MSHIQSTSIKRCLCTIVSYEAQKQKSNSSELVLRALVKSIQEIGFVTAGSLEALSESRDVEVQSAEDRPGANLWLAQTRNPNQAGSEVS